jgi:NTP pyrophosphatase (non-canonical NTP hydrolase)
MLDLVQSINRGFARKFPNGVGPYQIMTRLMEECGELAQQVNHFERSGVKAEKYGEPDRARLAQEAKGVLLTLFQAVDYYDLHAELRVSLEETLGRLRAAGYVADGPIEKNDG